MTSVTSSYWPLRPTYGLQVRRAAEPVRSIALPVLSKKNVECRRAQFRLKRAIEGKPLERAGRKASDLQRHGVTVAGLPKSISVVRIPRTPVEFVCVALALFAE